MANRYWVGGSGTWDLSSTTNWSATSGGSSGASVPTSSDNVIIDTNSGGPSIAINAAVVCANLDYSLGPASWTLTSGSLSIYGSFASYSTGGFNGSFPVNFVATTTGNTISCPGANGFSGAIVFNGVGGEWALTSNLIRTSGSGVGITHTAGILRLGTYTVTTQSYNASGTGTRTIDFGTGRIKVSLLSTTAFTTQTATNLTTTGTKIVEVIGLGAGGASASVYGGGAEAQAVSFYISTGVVSDSISVNGSMLDLNLTGSSATLTATSRTIYGSITLSSGCSLSSSTQITTFAATSGSKTITTNGKSFPFPLTFNGVGGTWVLQESLTLNYSVSVAGRTINLTAGTLDTNGFAVTAGAFSSNNSNIRSLIGGSSWTINGVGTIWNIATSTNFTLGTITILLTGISSSKLFAGGGLSYTSLTNSGNGPLTISGSNTFGTFTSTGSGYSVAFPVSPSQTNFTGAVSLNFCTITSSTPGSQHTLSKASGTVTTNNSAITDSFATGGAVWTAVNSTNNGNNSGWIFSNPSGAMIAFF